MRLKYTKNEHNYENLAAPLSAMQFLCVHHHVCRQHHKRGHRNPRLAAVPLLPQHTLRFHLVGNNVKLLMDVCSM